MIQPVSANRGRNTALIDGDRLRSPNRDEYIMRAALYPVFTSNIEGRQEYKGYVYTDNTTRKCTLKNGVLVLGCCTFNKTNTRIIKRWVRQWHS